MSRSKRIGIKAIKKELSSCAFDPNTPGPLKVIFDVGESYYLPRARELILEAENNPELADQRLMMAIQLITYYRLITKT